MSGGLKQKSDEELVDLFKSEDNRLALGELFKRHSLMCFAICNKYLKNEMAAEDATMTVFEKLFKDLKNHDVKNFKAWLHSVCRNYCLMELRKPNHILRMLEFDEENGDQFVNLETFLHQEEKENNKEQTLQSLEKAILQLKDKQKECIELFYLQQKSYDDIALLTGYSLNEVKSYIQNGKRNLKIVMSGKYISQWLLIISWIQTNA